MLYSPHARYASISELRKMVNNTDCDALRLSRKLGTSSRRDDCARRTCDTETKMRSTAEISFPRKFLLVHSAAVGERTESESREDERQSAYQSSARNVCWVFWVLTVCSRGAYSEELLFAFKRWNCLIKISRKKVASFWTILSLESLLFLQRFCLPGRRRVLLCALIKEKKRGAEVDRSRTERESERRYDK